MHPLLVTVSAPAAVLVLLLLDSLLQAVVRPLLAPVSPPAAVLVVLLLVLVVYQRQ